MTVKISTGNSKLGKISSVSLPAGLTCRNDCECHSKCYAKKLERLRPAVRNAYSHNLEILKTSPDTYWREVEAAIMMSRFFRFHVSGDIPDYDYFLKMVDIAKRNSHCQILCFTKKYEIINRYITERCQEVFEGIPSCIIPKNLHIIFSVWKNLDCNNIYHLPEAHVRYRDKTTTAKPEAKECGGNCSECALTDDGCWNLSFGEQVIFNEH